MSWSEDRLHRWLARAARPRVLVGAQGHDAAVMQALAPRSVACVDACAEGVHFESTLAPRLVGRKAAARALSDLAASAAHPRALLLAVSAPRSCDEAWLQAAIRGVQRMGLEHGAPLVGGDLCARPGPRELVVTALGLQRASRTPPARERARAGDVLFVTGALGGSLLGRHARFEPRIEQGLWLAAHGAHALMDVSDGLAWDLHRMARAAGVRFEIELARVPVHADARRRAHASGQDALWHALHDGEDHELIAAVPAQRARFTRFSAIGRVRKGHGLWLVDARGKARRWKPSEGGWKHGAD